jgi:hypothetical protein
MNNKDESLYTYMYIYNPMERLIRRVDALKGHGVYDFTRREPFIFLAYVGLILILRDV